MLLGEHHEVHYMNRDRAAHRHEALVTNGAIIAKASLEHEHECVIHCGSVVSCALL